MENVLSKLKVKASCHGQPGEKMRLPSEEKGGSLGKGGVFLPRCLRKGTVHSVMLYRLFYVILTVAV